LRREEQPVSVVSRTAPAVKDVGAPEAKIPTNLRVPVVNQGFIVELGQ
jgi:hypothetical protein